MSNTDFICGQCPLATCDEQSLWCAFRWATQLNEAQQAVVGVKMMPKKTVKRKRRKPGPRSAYMAEYYQANREKKLSAANARHAEIKAFFEEQV